MKNKPLYWQRVDAVINLFLENKQYLETQRYEALTEIIMQKFKVQKSIASSYINEARNIVEKIYDLPANEPLKKAVLDREFLYSKIKETDPKTALEILKDRDKLLNLYDPNQREPDDFNYTLKKAVEGHKKN